MTLQKATRDALYAAFEPAKARDGPPVRAVVAPHPIGDGPLTFGEEL